MYLLTVTIDFYMGKVIILITRYMLELVAAILMDSKSRILAEILNSMMP